MEKEMNNSDVVIMPEVKEGKFLSFFWVRKSMLLKY